MSIFVDPIIQQQGMTSAEQDGLQNESLSNDKKKSKAHRLAKAKAEAARLKLELAEARLALIELESSDGELTNEQSELMSVAKLPAFNGDHYDWDNFCAAYYESANRFTEAENMSRLRRSLLGKAKKEVKGCIDSKHVMETLELSFSPKSLAKAELERLKRLRLLVMSQHELKVFATEIETCTRNLKQLNCSEYLYGLPAMSLIETVLGDPVLNRIRQEWSIWSGRSEPILPLFCSFIRRKAESNLCY